jgi:hypothetical protein
MGINMNGGHLQRVMQILEKTAGTGGIYLHKRRWGISGIKPYTRAVTPSAHVSTLFRIESSEYEVSLTLSLPRAT